MRIECIAIGTELLTTTRMDTNSVWLAQRLADFGLAFHRKTAVGDNREDLRALFKEALERSDLILCTGGLGPTFDDFTKEILAEVIGAELVEDPEALRDIMGFYDRLQRPMPPTNRKQALIPAGAEILRNPVGTAPGVWWAHPKGFPGRRVALLPGVPREMKYLWEHEIEPRLKPLGGATLHTLRLLVGSEGESALEERTAHLRDKPRHLDWTILASLGTVELLARSADPQALETARVDFVELLGEGLICAGLVSIGGASLEEIVLEALKARGETLALAESMTGGLVASRLTAIPGSSQAFQGGAVVYSVEAKARLAGLDPEFIQAHGSVSETTTKALAEGIRTRMGSTWALAITGNAGPTEDPSGPAPVGTCHIAVAGPDGTAHTTHPFPGERIVVQSRTSTWALDFLRRCIQKAR
jgi:nicotinamide-nucleotide amidase